MLIITLKSGILHVLNCFLCCFASTPPSKAEAFEVYKSDSGSEIYHILKENKSVLKERLARLHNLTANINSIKRDIDRMSSELQLYREQRQSQG